MVIRRGEIWWADLPNPVASEPGFRRPVLIVQADWMTGSGIRTVVVAALTSNLRLAQLPGNVVVQPGDSGLPKPSVVNVSQLTALDQSELVQRMGRLPPSLMQHIDAGLRLVLDLVN